MKLTIDKSQLNRKSKADCRVKSFIIALAMEGLCYTPSEILLDANAFDFAFVNINPDGTAIHTLLGVSSDLFEKFSENTGINISHYSDRDDAEDLEIIYNAIRNGHCVIAVTDRYGLFRLLNPKIFRNISANKHMTQHMIVIYGVDLEKKQFLICEASSAIKKFHSVWIDIDKLNAVRECEFLGLGIKKDIYIIENTNGYIKPNFNEMLLLQINKLKNALSDNIPRLREFVSFFENNDKMNHTLERYLILQSQVLAVTVGGFDKSQYFYRGDFLEIFSSIYAGKKRDDFILQLFNIKNKWKNIVEQLINLSKGLDSEDIIKVWKQIILVAENEFSFCENFISEYNNINLKGGGKGGRIKRGSAY